MRRLFRKKTRAPRGHEDGKTAAPLSELEAEQPSFTYINGFLTPTVCLEEKETLAEKLDNWLWKMALSP